MFKKICALIMSAALCLTLSACSNSNNKSETKEDASTTEDVENMPGSTDEGETYIATINVKDYGTIKVRLYEGIAPQTVENFVKLANEGFYNGLTFHRIIDGFMIQGGDPNGDGTGGSDETIEGEFKSNGFNNTLKHSRGVISMARSSDPDSASSQFFIMQEDASHLDGEYAAFGKVTEGMDVVDAIVEAAKPVDGNGTIEKDQQPVIESITIEQE